MPLAIVRGKYTSKNHHGGSSKHKCYGVKNKATGKMHSKCTTKAKAARQMRLINAVDHGWHKPKK